MNNKQNTQTPDSSDSRQDARAPYNFIPLPERAVGILDQPGVTTLDEALPSHNTFRSDRLHGHFDVTLTTESPLYIRGPLTRHEAANKEEYRNKPGFFHTGDPNDPVIPGSSLRGMIRALVEIVSWAKVTRVSDSPKIFYRAVASEKEDPLGEHYKRIVGQPGKNIRAGYLEREGDSWFISPAMLHMSQAFVKVKALKINGQGHEDVQAVQGLTALNSSKYRIQYHDVVTAGEFRPLKSSGYAVAVRSIKPGESRAGVLVCTGNMAESSGEAGGRVQTSRRNFILVLERDPNAQPIQIAPQAVADYQDGLTPFQEEPPFAEKYGCLVEGRPIFYILPTQGQMVQYFGHAPFSRIAATTTKNNKSRAVTPYDFVPDELREHPERLDLAEAMFGYVRNADTIKLLEENLGKIPQGDPRRAYAGRISVTDARMITQIIDPYEPEITPPILSSPKPTTFQHYLEQPKGKHTQRANLYHYDTKPSQGQPPVRIRGHKLYWRQRRDTTAQIPGATTESLETLKDKSQRTRVRPVKKGVQFRFRVDFENLTHVELGALTWVLALGSDGHHPKARHMLGMGKPFGMGVVKLEANLALRNRRQRYMSLFVGSEWASGDSVTDNIGEVIGGFVTFISDGRVKDYESRTQELLTMLEGRDPKRSFTYMTIEPVNEFKNRPVLPRPTEVIPSPEMLAKREEERLREEEERRKAEEQRLHQQEIEKRNAEKLARKDMIGDEVKGEVFEVKANGDIWFSFQWLDAGEYEGYVARNSIVKQRREGETIKAKIIERRENKGRIEFVCEQIVEDKKKK